MAVKQREQGLGRRLTFEEHFEAMNKARGTERDFSLTQLRVVVCENPYARVPLPREIFRGPYDETYGVDEATRSHITRLFAGERIKELESQEQPVNSPIQRTAEESDEAKRGDEGQTYEVSIGHAEGEGTTPLPAQSRLRGDVTERLPPDSHPRGSAHAERADSLGRRTARIVSAHPQGRGLLRTGLLWRQEERKSLRYHARPQGKQFPCRPCGREGQDGA
jgi:hypothetical protein